MSVRLSGGVCGRVWIYDKFELGQVEAGVFVVMFPVGFKVFRFMFCAFCFSLCLVSSLHFTSHFIIAQRQSELSDAFVQLLVSTHKCIFKIVYIIHCTLA